MGFFDEHVNIFSIYEVDVQFTGKVLGGIPNNPDLITGWLAGRGGITDKGEAVAKMTQIMEEMGVEFPENATHAELMAAAKKWAEEHNANGFKRDPLLGLCLESRQIKAALKESCNSLFAGHRWGPTSKGPKAYLAERVHISPLMIPLGVFEPTDNLTIIGHVSGPQGQKNTLTKHDYVERPKITFQVKVVDDCIKFYNWARMWTFIQENGIGAVRSQDFGRCEVTDWRLVRACDKPEDPMHKAPAVKPKKGEKAVEEEPEPPIVVGLNHYENGMIKESDLVLA